MTNLEKLEFVKQQWNAVSNVEQFKIFVEDYFSIPKRITDEYKENNQEVVDFYEEVCEELQKIKQGRFI